MILLNLCYFLIVLSVLIPVITYIIIILEKIQETKKTIPEATKEEIKKEDKEISIYLIISNKENTLKFKTKKDFYNSLESFETLKPFIKAETELEEIEKILKYYYIDYKIITFNKEV